MPFMTRIPSDLARFGLKVELLPGWETRGSSSFAPAGVTDHWTAGPRGTTGRPSLNVVTNGRPGIPGPLCNIYFARDATCVVVAAGRANHAGAGGFRGLVGNSAVYGIEAECGGDGDWTPAQRQNYPRLNAALLSGLGRDHSWAHGHNEWAPTRKIDIRDIIVAVRNETGTILGNPGSGPMPIAGGDFVMDTDARKAFDEVIRLLGNLNQYPGRAANPFEHAAFEHVKDGQEARRMLGIIFGWNNPANDRERQALTKLWGSDQVPDVDEDALAAALVNRLPTLDLARLADEDVLRIAEASAAQIGKQLVDG
jgi:N-acetylmuramoyl-L-alanine amidase